MECELLGGVISLILFASILMALKMRFDVNDRSRFESLKNKWYEFIVYIFISILFITLIIGAGVVVIFLIGKFGAFISWALCNLHWCKC